MYLLLIPDNDKHTNLINDFLYGKNKTLCHYGMTFKIWLI